MMQKRKLANFLLYLVAAFLAVCYVGYGKAVLIAADDDLSEEIYEVEVPCKTNDPPENKCLPKRCKRTIKDDVFSEDDIQILRSIALKGYATRGDGEGGPTILDINTGYIRDSAGLDNLFTKSDSNTIFAPDDFGHYGKIIRKLRDEVLLATGAQDLYFTAPTFITRLDGRNGWEPRDFHDQYWHVHADRNNTLHYHYSGLLYLSMFKKDFTGGRVLFYDADSSRLEQVVEPRPGRMLIFSSGHENPHKVERVTSGQRLVLAFWFTCNPEKQFEIFLDGNAHTTFSKKVGASYLLQKQQQERQNAQDHSLEKPKSTADAEDL